MVGLFPGCCRHLTVGRTSATPRGLGGGWLTRRPACTRRTALHPPPGGKSRAPEAKAESAERRVAASEELKCLRKRKPARQHEGRRDRDDSGKGMDNGKARNSGSHSFDQTSRFASVGTASRVHAQMWFQENHALPGSALVRNAPAKSIGPPVFRGTRLCGPPSPHASTERVRSRRTSAKISRDRMWQRRTDDEEKIT